MNEGNEKAYRTMGFSGVMALSVGIVMICVGVISGVLLLISGAKLMQNKSGLLF
ncbi:MAG: hypothetical protein J6P45_03685 [Lachnospiraceae bacterium]|nr:hypothetical protein [Lachnospiraceae bacterium]MBR1876035.1 hypothetical protein [Lachnospiraceae bacterium]